MKKPFCILICFASIFLSLVCLSGCGSEPDQGELIMRGWTNKRGEAYIYLKIKMEGKWEVSVNIADATTRIIQVRGKASGQWHIEDNALVLTVFESNINKIFKKDVTNFYEIVKLNEKVMELLDTHGQLTTWKAIELSKKQAGKSGSNSIRMAPFTVNLNKLRSRDKDRYLCVNFKIILKEFLPGSEVTKVHPKAREAVLIYLSSLVYKDIKNLDNAEEIQKNLQIILNPYIGNMIQKIEIDHIIVSSTYDRVEEFLIEHSIKARISKERNEKDPQKEKGKE